MEKRSVLIVDDDEDYLRLVESIMAKAGIEAYYATNGEEAVEFLKKGSFASMITDLHMEGMDGYELAMIAKELSPDIDIVLITGEISPDVGCLAVQAGISEVLAKPVRADQLQEIVRGQTVRFHVA